MGNSGTDYYLTNNGLGRVFQETLLEQLVYTADLEILKLNFYGILWMKLNIKFL